MSRRKSLLIGINYTGSQNELRGCHQDVENVAQFLSYRGYSDDPHSQVILRDDLDGNYNPTGHNILAAMDWLVSEPGTINFLHYSGHGGQVQDPTGNHPSGVLDTICPVDFQENGQIDSDMLHQKLVKRLPSNSSLFVILDCCHSGSALELPFVYRGDDDGNVNLVDNIKQGVRLLGEANSLIQGGSFNMDEAQDLYAGATSFFRSFKHMGDQQQSGLGQDANYQENSGDQKMVTMFSGCRDDQTSADANIQGTSEGAMSWAFLETMKRIPNPTYIEVRDSNVELAQSVILTHYRRGNLTQSQYSQVPQLSVGENFDLNQPLAL